MTTVSQQRNPARPLTGQARPTAAMHSRASLAAAVLVACLLLLVARLVHLQILEHDRYKGLAAHQQTVRRALSARRGNVYDCRGRLLATSVRRWSVYADPAAVERPEVATYMLSRVLGLSRAEVRRRLNRPGNFAWIKRQIPDASAEYLRRLQFQGIHLRREYHRAYPQNRVAAQVVGFTDVDGRGLAGVELELDRILRSKPGREEVTCDASRRVVRRADDQPVEPPVDGYDVYLTVDSYIQNIAQEELAPIIEKHAPECAWAVVLDVRTGALLAMVSWPDFDANAPTKSDVSAQKNRIITDAYEFGSVMKPLTVAAALEQGLVTPETEFDCHNGEWPVGARVVHDVHPYGMLTVSDIITKSSNIGAAQIGLLLGADRFHGALSRFGLGMPSGVTLPGEISGIMRPAGRWNKHSLISIAFGQELAATPLAVARAFACLANEGVLLRPQVVQKVVRSSTGRAVVRLTQPDVLGRAVSKRTADQVLAMMQRVVDEGTGTRAQLEEYTVAGKTGTAGLAAPGGRGYAEGLYLSSFVAIAPVEEPRIVVLVSLKAPSKNGYYGGVVSSRSCGQIIRRTLGYLKVPPRAPSPNMARLDE